MESTTRDHLITTTTTTTTITSLPTALAAAILLLLTLIALSYILRNTDHDIRSTLFQLLHKPLSTSEVVSLRIYPIKSCRGFEIDRTTVQMHGLDLDRQWMFVDATTREFLTIRQIPQMTLINTGLSQDGVFLELSITGAEEPRTVRVPARPSPDWLAAHTTLAQVKIWDIYTDGHLYGPEVNDFFSQFLNRAVCLVYKGPTPRVLRGNGSPKIIGRTQDTYFPDVLPLLIGSEASLAELNSRLTAKGADPITIERFRPNIIVRGTVPWEEDSWKLVRFRGSDSARPLDVDVVARCARCQVPNVNPDTAEKHKHEPWNTLMSYRRVDEGIKYKPCFGMLSVPRNEGEIYVGMKFEVLNETKQHRYITGF
ncbi:hypothetical protein DTO166G4_4347 [Paecilomyces variotii]|uniref:MOSC domain-containing protein n=1 Tax=Byssochlamys spectabilis TaxID=264951 RepID=A0A443HIG2_BYSSP|nr:hypothetical protein C8Q69DRAFT_482283 [Paecilomyces variotii]KAJ9214081.1 hypothetical protein DTO166G4_4347 [Paecilomyces variotii]KAJ9241772.1 hypothetical protein DTO166G5_848 [Paecilomyces variotii]KAJ9258851.1 hypothetical protein DTO195F2_5089 [Paecilomyces variotii]KAJ9364947.1 hypothetical protein DTO280E4_1242 [Paecilomyces variotii]KAJ9372939.1 hypothetical protein DTO282E5_2349 [Paecilomyces variotii]